MSTCEMMCHNYITEMSDKAYTWKSFRFKPSTEATKTLEDFKKICDIFGIASGEALLEALKSWTAQKRVEAKSDIDKIL